MSYSMLTLDEIYKLEQLFLFFFNAQQKYKLQLLELWMNKTTTTLFLLVLLGVASTLETSSSHRLLQITTRTATVTKMCANYPTRDTLVDAKAEADSASAKTAMKGSFKAEGNTLIGAIINDPNGILAGVVTQGPNLYTDLGLFAGPFVLGLVILWLIWPFLCCCCCCPGCCPSKCCQKPETEQYTKCELFWPAIVLVLAFLLIVVASVIGITRSSDIETSYRSVGCSAAITFDDVINGNASTTGKYFIGMRGLSNSLGGLQGNLAGVKTQMDKIKYSNTSGPLRQAYDAGTTLLTAVSSIPDNSVGGSLGAYTYNHFDGTAASISSTFPTALGTAQTGSQSGAVGIAYQAIDLINQGLKTIGDNAGNFSDQFSSVSGAIDSLSGSMNDMASMVEGFDSTFSGIDDTVSPIMKIITMAITAFFGVFIGLSVLGIIGTLFMTCCDKFSCRYLLYFICVIFLILGIISFLIATLFSVITPVLYFGCDFLTTSISSTAGFNANLAGPLGAQFSSYLGVCLPGGSGDIINQLQGVDLSTINGLSSAANSMNTFSASTIQSGVETALNTLRDQINKYYYTDVYDFTSASDKTIMANIANPAHASWSTCTVNSFSQDSWVPSLRQSDISCAVTTSTATSTNCPSSTQIQAGRASSASCFGCVDSMKVLLNSGTAQITDINARYGTVGACGVWATAMGNLWTEYYAVKKTNIGPVQGRMTSTISSYNTATTGYHDRIGTLGSSFTTISGNLQNIVSSVFDPQYGMIAGLNCLVLGEDLNLMSNTICTKFFITFYYLRLTLGLSAFGILFALCCTTCSGVRAFKHSARLGSILPKQLDGHQQSTMAALHAK